MKTGTPIQARFSLKLSNGNKIFQVKSEPIGTGMSGSVYLFEDENKATYAVKRLILETFSPLISASS